MLTQLTVIAEAGICCLKRFRVVNRIIFGRFLEDLVWPLLLLYYVYLYFYYLYVVLLFISILFIHNMNIVFWCVYISHFPLCLSRPELTKAQWEMHSAHTYRRLVVTTVFISGLREILIQ